MKKYLKDIIYIAVIIVLCFALTVSVKSCKSYKHNLSQNIEALSDTVHYYKSKSKSLVAEKKALTGSFKDVKEVDKVLYNEVKDMKIKSSDVSAAAHISGEIDLGKNDTVFKVTHDTIYKGFSKDFDFSNKYRSLSGNVNYHKDSLKISFSKDIVNFDYTVAVTKDSKIAVKSNNPYIKYKEISGFTLPKKKQKRWGIGPYAGVSYDFVNSKIVPTVGIGIQYSIIRF